MHLLGHFQFQEGASARIDGWMGFFVAGVTL
jgi:hypothetical protein